MTANEYRNRFVKYAEGFAGCKQGDAKHKKIIDTFNTIKPLPDGWKMTYTAPWCAAAVSAWAKGAGVEKVIPLSANCGTMLNKAMKMGIWIESDNYIPQPGDLVLYDWGDSGIGDDKGAPDHVGVVTDIDKNVIYVLEGNKGNPSKCSYRLLGINGRYIRGFIHPKWETLADESKPSSGSKPAASGTLVNKIYRVISKIGMNVRALPSTASKIVGGIAYNKTFTATEEKGLWVKAKSPAGWVCKSSGGVKYLEEVKGTTTEPKQTLTKWQVIGRAGSNVRAGAGTNYRVVKAIPYGTKFTASKKSGNWVYSDGLKGWVCVKGSNGNYCKQI